MAGHEQLHTVRTAGESSAPGTDLAAGSIVGGYRIESVLGRGGMGTVYSAIDAELGRRVALKVVAGASSAGARAREQFVREATSAATVEHPNILPVYRGGSDGDQLFIAMRLVDGMSLQALVEQTGPLPAHRAARIVAQIGQALDAAHARGLVHRDVKPANILIADPGEDEHAYLADFGVAAAAGTERRWAGTYAYTAPEQLAEQRADGRADIYALGGVLYFSLTGRAPYDAADEVQALTVRSGGPPPSLADHAPAHTPQALEAVIDRALAHDPAERFSSGEELGRAALAARFDVAICAAPDDEQSAATLYAGLADHGLSVVDVDRDSPPAAVRAAGALVVAVGARGLSGWAREALIAARKMAADDRSYRIVTAIVPGGPSPFDPDLAFLGTHPWADLRDGVADNIERVVRALSGHATQRLGEATDIECPYPGLDAFDEQSAPDFFGRERETDQALDHLSRSRFLAVVGASGSGKSSLLHAGIIPRLRIADPATTVIGLVPGAHPLAALATALSGVGDDGGGKDAFDDEGVLDARVAASGRSRVIVVVDQLEEAFTLCADAIERECFLANLAYAATVPDGKTTVVVACRGDFFHRLAEHDGTRQLVSANQVTLGTMSARSLRAAIERPARRVAVELEPGLTRRILTDLPREPGSLPLLAHLLRELWDRRSADTLTLESYEVAGGVGGALARRADRVYGELSADQQQVAKRLLLRLTQPGDGTEDTRRRTTRAELLSIGDTNVVAAVLQRLVAARLLTTGTDDGSGAVSVDITHEALIRNWPTLRGWIDESRDQLRLHRRLTERSDEWHATGDEAHLLRGSSLAAWQDRDRSELNSSESTFLDASQAVADREQGARVRRLRIGIGSLAGAVAVVGAVASVALVARSTAREQRDVARSRQVAANARQQIAFNPEVATLVAHEAYSINPTIEAVDALRESLAAMHVRGALPLHDGAVNAIDVSRRGDVAVSAGEDGTVTTFDPSSLGASAPRLIANGYGPIADIALDADGAHATAITRDGRLLRWRDLTRTPTETTIASNPLRAMAATPNGAVAVIGDEAGNVHLVNVATMRRTASRRLSVDRIESLAISRDGTRVYAGTGNSDKARLFEWIPASNNVRALGQPVVQGIGAIALESGERSIITANQNDTMTRGGVGTSPTLTTVVVGSASQQSLALSEDGVAALGGADGAVSLWPTDSTRPPTRLPGHDGSVTDVAFVPGTDLLLSVDSTGVARWDQWRADGMRVVDKSTSWISVRTAPNASVALMNLTGEVATIALTGEASKKSVRRGDQAWWGTLVSATTWASLSGDRATLDVSVTGKRSRIPAPAGTENLKMSDNGRWLVASDFAGNFTQFDLTDSTMTPVLRLTGVASVSAFHAIAPDGALAVATKGGTISIWRAPNPRPQVITVAPTEIRSLAYSADGTHLAFGTRDGLMRVVDTHGTPQGPLLRHVGSVESVQLPIGTDLLVSGGDEVRISNWRTGAILGSWTVRGLSDATFDPATQMVVAAGHDGALATKCQTCGGPAELIALADQRVTRQLTADERAALVGTAER